MGKKDEAKVVDRGNVKFEFFPLFQTICLFD